MQFLSERRRIAGRDVDWLGAVRTPDRYTLFLRIGAEDVALWARPLEPGTPAFVRGRRVAVLYRIHGDGPERPDAGIIRVLEALAAELLGDEDRLLQAADEAARGDGPDLPLRRDLAWGCDEPLGALRMRGPVSGRAARIEVAPRGQLPAPLMNWSFGLFPEGAPLSAEDLPAAQELALRLVAGQLLRGGQEPDRPAEATLSIKLSYLHDSVVSADELRHAAEAVSGKRLGVEIVWPSRCLQRCRFCRGTDRPLRDEVDAQEHLTRLLEVLRPGLRDAASAYWTLTGNDVLRATRLPQLLDLLRDQGPSEGIDVVGPVDALADRGFAKQLAAQGIRCLTPSLFGSDAAVHDAVAGTGGAFDRLVAAVGAMQDLDLDYRLTIVVIRENLPHLRAAVERALALGRRPILQSYFAASGGPELSGRLFAPYGELSRELSSDPGFYRRVLQGIVFVPPCAVPPWARSMIAPAPSDLSGGGRDLAPLEACRTCPRRGVDCAGVERTYVELFGDGEFRPLSPPLRPVPPMAAVSFAVPPENSLGFDDDES